MSLALPIAKKKLITLVYFSFDRGAGTEELHYTDVQSDYTDTEAQVWTSVPTMEVKIPPYQGGLEQGAVSIDLPASLELADLLSNGQPFPPVKVVVRQDITQFADDPDAEGETKRLVLFRGRVHRALRNKNGNKGLVQLDVTGSKGRLAAPLGIQINPTCGLSFAGATALLPGSNPVSLTDLVGYWPFDASTRTLVGTDVSFENVAAPGNPDISNTVANAWNASIFEDDPGRFAEGVEIQTGASGLAPGGGGALTTFASFGSSDFTVGFWWQSQAAGTSAVHCSLVSKLRMDSIGGPSGNTGWGILCPAGTRDLRFYCNAAVLDAPSALAHDTNYHHIVVRRSGSDWSLWVDGVQVDTASSASAISYADAPNGTSTVFAVADHETGGVHGRWPGHYDDLGIWERALSDGEIGALYGDEMAIIGLPVPVGCTLDPTNITLAGAGSAVDTVQSRVIASIAGTVLTLTGLTAPGSSGNGNIYEMGYLKLGDLRMDIRAWDRTDPTTVHLRERPPAWWLGETVEAHPGCDGQHATCRDRWDNERDFSGAGIRMPNYSTHEASDA